VGRNFWELLCVEIVITLKGYGLILQINLGLGRLSIQESHPWGFIHNPCGLPYYVNTEMNSKTCDPNYENQHWAARKDRREPWSKKIASLIISRKWGC
jgi:hypothetical protein